MKARRAKLLIKQSESKAFHYVEGFFDLMPIA